MITTSDFCKSQYGEKLYKISLSGGFTCPNRDGTLGVGGCIFCSAGGSGDFSESSELSINEQIDRAKKESLQNSKGIDTLHTSSLSQTLTHPSII